MIHVGSCSLGTPLQIYKHIWWYMLPTVTTANIIVTCIFSLPVTFIWRFCPTVIDSITWQHTEVQWDFLFGSGPNSLCVCVNIKHAAEKQQASSWGMLAPCSILSSSVETELIILHHTYTPTQAGLQLMLQDMWFSKFPCFIFYHLMCNQHSSF